MITRPFFAILFFITVSCTALPRPVAADLGSQLEGLVRAARSSTIGVSVENAATGAAVFRSGDERSVKPASILKLLTTLTAFERLGPEFRYHTDFLVQGDALYVRGSGDPSFTIESAWMVGRELKMRGLGAVKDIVLDGSALGSTKHRQGQRAFQTGSSALSFNFNSVRFVACPTSVGTPARVFADPFEAGISVKSTVVTTGKGGSAISADETSPTQYRVTGQMRAGDRCKEVLRSVSNPDQYFGRVTRSVLNLLGVSVRGEVRSGAIPSTARLLYSYESKPLALILRDLNTFSTNMIAEQVLLALGSRSEGHPVLDHTLGLKALGEVAARLGFSEKSVTLKDGSGLDHDNRVPTRLITRVLSAAARNPRIGPLLEAILPEPGGTGTLKRRNFGTQTVIRAKTGSLNGVTSLAGYLVGASGTKYAFSIIQNGVVSRDDAWKFEERIVQTLHRLG